VRGLRLTRREVAGVVDQEDFDRLQKKVETLTKDLKEAKRLHEILDEYCSDSFKLVNEQTSKLREDLAKVVTAMASGTKKKP